MKRSEVRYDQHGPRRLMAEAEGYVLVRRPNCFPSVMSREEWDALAPEVVLPPTLPEPERPKVVDLMEALEASLAAIKKGAKG